MDDAPTWMRTIHGPTIAMPYSFEYNDAVVWVIDKHSSDEQHRRAIDAVENELAISPAC